VFVCVLFFAMCYAVSFGKVGVVNFLLLLLLFCAHIPLLSLSLSSPCLNCNTYISLAHIKLFAVLMFRCDHMAQLEDDPVVITFKEFKKEEEMLRIKEKEEIARQKKLGKLASSNKFQQVSERSMVSSDDGEEEEGEVNEGEEDDNSVMG
jgi:hypothetical protein